MPDPFASIIRFIDDKEFDLAIKEIDSLLKKSEASYNRQSVISEILEEKKRKKRKLDVFKMILK